MENKHNQKQILSDLPLNFEKNIGQHDEEVKFLIKQNKSTTYFTKDEVIISLVNNTDEGNKVNSLRISLEESNKDCDILGTNQINCKVNYFKGSTGKEWTTNIPLYEELIYKEIYPSIDLIYYSNKGILEHDFVVKPYANIDSIKFKFDGADNINIDDEGNLEIHVKGNIIKLLKPIAYQQIEGKRIEIGSNFIIENDNIKFQIEEYDKSNTLVIDPQVLYSTYVINLIPSGQISSLAEPPSRAVVDDEEIAYIVGTFYNNMIQSEVVPEAYLVRVDTKKSGIDSLIDIYYLGGSKETAGISVAIDKNKNVYITGVTWATDFPIVKGLQTSHLVNSSISYLTKINTKTSSILYSTYLGSLEDCG